LSFDRDKQVGSQRENSGGKGFSLLGGDLFLTEPSHDASESPVDAGKRFAYGLREKNQFL
jgi:hypothetical protein